MDICVYSSLLWTFMYVFCVELFDVIVLISLRYILGSGLAELQGSSMFKLLKNCFSKCLHCLTFLPILYENFSFPTSSPKLNSLFTCNSPGQYLHFSGGYYFDYLSSIYCHFLLGRCLDLYFSIGYLYFCWVVIVAFFFCLLCLYITKNHCLI